MIGTHTCVNEPSEDDIRLWKAKFDDIYFCSLPAAIFLPLRGTQGWRLVNLRKTILWIISRSKQCKDLNLLATVWIFIFFYFFDSWLYLLNGVDDEMTVKMGNFQIRYHNGELTKLSWIYKNDHVEWYIVPWVIEYLFAGTERVNYHFFMAFH